MQKSIYIRKTEPYDGKALRDIYECENAYHNTLHLPHQSVDIFDKRLANIPEHIHSYVTTISNKDGQAEVVGNIALVLSTNARRRHVASFGMAVKDHQRSKGIGSTLLNTVLDLADNWLNLHRIEITVYTDNKAAIALYKKFGFIIEGEARDFAYRNGSHVDAYFMARIKPY